MTFSTLARRAAPTAVALGLTLAAAVTPAITATAVTSTPGCPDVYFIGARGSGETAQTPPDGLGTEVSELATDVASALSAQGRTMQTYADSYRADSVDDFIPSSAETAKLEAMIDAGNTSAAITYYYDHNVSPYLASIKAGIKTAVDDARIIGYYCPNSLLMMAGYSQGAMVVHQTEWRLAKKYPAIAARIVGTILLADGDRVPNSRTKLFGTATSSSEGVRTWLKENNGKDAFQPASTATICNAGDIVCDFNAHRLDPAPSAEQAGAKVHTTYAGDPALGQAATWVANQALVDLAKSPA